MPLKASPVARAGCAQFGGFYVGAQAGVANYSNSFNDVDSFGRNQIDLFLQDSVSQTGRGALAGAQAGYNWQSGCTVFGIESDWAWTSAKATTVLSDGGNFPPETTDHITPTSKLRWFGTTRIRTGVVVDNLLLYVTGGLAYANFKRDALFFNDNGPVQETFSSSKTRLGWTAGVGTEWAINHNWSLKTEALYMQFEKDQTTYTSQFLSEGTQFRLKNEDSVWVGRIGLNYRFGGY
jgi:outer membrane immunogenic protein